MKWQTRSSLTPKVLSENQWQLYWLSVENEFTHFQQVMQLYRRVRKKQKKRRIGTVCARLVCIQYSWELQTFICNIMNITYFMLFPTSTLSHYNHASPTMSTLQSAWSNCQCKQSLVISLNELLRLDVLLELVAISDYIK